METDSYMKNKTLITLAMGTLVVSAGALASETSATSGAGPVPDKIFFGGPIITMNDHGLMAEAVAIKNGRIIAVDSLNAIEAMTENSTERIDLEGKTMMPGFIDSHSHFLITGAITQSRVDLNPPPIGSVNGIDDIIAKLREQATQSDEATVVAGIGYDDTLLTEMRHPTKVDLDKVSTEVPVIIFHISGHLAVGNSRALAMTGITSNTPDPDGGHIERNEAGEPTGVMEGNAIKLLYALLPERTEDDWVAAIAKASEMWASAGFTTASDNLTSPNQIHFFKEALERGEQRIRVNYWPRVRTVEAVHAFPAVQSGTDISNGERMLVQGPVKFTIDGSPQGYTAHFSEPYSTQRAHDHADYRGFPYWEDRNEFFGIIEQLHREGYQLTIHGNGDQGIQDALDAYASAQRAHPRENTRHGIIHAQFSRPDQLVQMAALGISPSFFIGHTFYWGDRHKNVFVGPNRSSHMSPLRGALDQGVKFSLHTDTPVTPIDGIQMIWSAVNRISTSGDTIGEAQRIGTYEALKAITTNAAWQFFEEDIKGSIEPGKLADFVVLSDNPLTVSHVDPLAIKDIKVVQTIVGGNTVFQGETGSTVARHFPNQATAY